MCIHIVVLCIKRGKEKVCARREGKRERRKEATRRAGRIRMNVFELNYTEYESLGLVLVESPTGFPVVKGRPTGQSANRGLHQGDILIELNGDPLESLPFPDVLQRIKFSGRPVLLTFTNLHTPEMRMKYYGQQDPLFFGGLGVKPRHIEKKIWKQEDDKDSSSPKQGLMSRMFGKKRGGGSKSPPQRAPRTAPKPKVETPSLTKQVSVSSRRGSFGRASPAQRARAAQRKGMPSEQQSPPAPARARPSKKIAKRATKRASHILQEHISEGREGYTLKEETQPVQNSALLHGPDDGATTLVVGREYQSASSVAKKNVALSHPHMVAPSSTGGSFKTRFISRTSGVVKTSPLSATTSAGSNVSPVAASSNKRATGPSPVKKTAPPPVPVKRTAPSFPPKKKAPSPVTKAAPPVPVKRTAPSFSKQFPSPVTKAAPTVPVKRMAPSFPPRKKAPSPMAKAAPPVPVKRTAPSVPPRKKASSPVAKTAPMAKTNVSVQKTAPAIPPKRVAPPIPAKRAPPAVPPKKRDPPAIPPRRKAPPRLKR